MVCVVLHPCIGLLCFKFPKKKVALFRSASMAGRAHFVVWACTLLNISTITGFLFVNLTCLSKFFGFVHFPVPRLHSDSVTVSVRSAVKLAWEIAGEDRILRFSRKK
jgi:hypothetical protein